METEPINFKLSLIENTIHTNTDFFILFGATMLNGFTEIIAYKNTVTLRPTSTGFKGLVGWDTPSGGGEITYCPIIRASLNNLPSNLRVDYSPLPNSTDENPILCFKIPAFTTSLTVPINPPLVGLGESGITQEEMNNILTALSTNTSNIATNTNNISTNTSNIITNTSNIATVTNNISTKYFKYNF